MGNIIDYWFTTKTGAHVPVMIGETKTMAMKRVFKQKESKRKELNSKLQDEYKKLFEELILRDLSIYKIDEYLDRIKEIYLNSSDDSIGNLLIPAKSEYLSDNVIDYIGVIKEYRFSYNWPSNMGFNGSPTPYIVKAGTIIDRIGDEYGKFCSPVYGGYAYSFKERGLPYLSTKTDITKEPAYHRYRVVKDINNLTDAICEYMINGADYNTNMFNEFLSAKDQFEKWDIHSQTV